jgi:hypothetical protein
LAGVAAPVTAVAPARAGTAAAGTGVAADQVAAPTAAWNGGSVGVR